MIERLNLLRRLVPWAHAADMSDVRQVAAGSSPSRDKSSERRGRAETDWCCQDSQCKGSRSAPPNPWKQHDGGVADGSGELSSGCSSPLRRMDFVFIWQGLTTSQRTMGGP